MRSITMAAAGAAVLGLAALPLIGQRAGDTATSPSSATAVQQAQPSTQEDFRWSGSVARGDEVEIKGIFGRIRAVPATGDRVEVTATNPGRVAIRVVEHEDGVTICTDYRGGEARAADRNPCEHHGERHGGSIDADEDDENRRVDFVVRVPAGVRFSGSAVMGDVEAEGLRSPVKAATVSGDVTVSTTEEAEAASVSGDVTVTMGRMPSRDLSFATVSGDIELRLPADAGADVKAQSLSGQIQSDWTLERGPMAGAKEGDRNGAFHVDVRIGSRAEGRIGRGGPDIELTTVSGDIRVARNR